MKAKIRMMGILLVISILTAFSAAGEVPRSSSFFTLYGQVYDNAGPVDGATVSLTINGVAKTTVTAPNSRGESGFYQFELANFPDVISGTQINLSATAAGKSVSRILSRTIIEPQREDVNLAPSGDISMSVDAPARSSVVNVKATYAFVLTNPGDEEETYDLTIDNPQQAIATLDMQKISVGAGKSGLIVLDVSSATVGSFVVKVTGTYQKTPTIIKSATITTTTTVYPTRGMIKGDGSILSASFTAKAKNPPGNAPANGNVNYIDSTANMNINSVQINLVGVTTDKKKGVITGLAQVNGAGAYYLLYIGLFITNNLVYKHFNGLMDVFPLYLAIP